MNGWHASSVTAIATELERTLERLEPEKAKALESRVREALSEAAGEEELPSIEELKRRMPEFADIIGCWADIEFELPPESSFPPTKSC